MHYPYHSALTYHLDTLEKMSFYESNESVVFSHDLVDGVADHFRSAEAIYSEPPWRDGYQIFARRAGIQSDFYSFISQMAVVIELLDIPTYLILGKHMLSRLNPPVIQPISLNGYSCFLGIWGGSLLSGIKTSNEVLIEVVRRYSVILDFCCGYGNVARTCISQGKRFICSDVNKQCIYYIATRIMMDRNG